MHARITVKIPVVAAWMSFLCAHVSRLGTGLTLQVVTIATEETDGYKRFMAAAEHFDIQVEVYASVHVNPRSVISSVNFCLIKTGR